MTKHTDDCIGGDRGPCNCGAVDDFANAITDIQMAHVEQRMIEIEKTHPNKKWTTRELVAIGMEVDPLSLSKMLGDSYAKSYTER